MTGTNTNYRERIYEKYASNFQDTTEIFDENKALRWGRGYSYYLRNWLPNKTNASILDVACGGGKLLYTFKILGYQNITGVDLSPEQIDIARQVTPNVFEGNILDWLEEHPSEFDLITGLDIIEHLNKPEIMRFLDGCFGALKPGGRIILQTPNAESPMGNSIRYSDFTHEVGFNYNSLSRLLKITGFERVEAHEQGPIPYRYSGLSSIRFIIWQLFRLGIIIWNLVEMGVKGSGIFTRNILISGIKP